jgi:hypothetical protein
MSALDRNVRGTKIAAEDIQNVTWAQIFVTTVGSGIHVRPRGIAVKGTRTVIKAHTGADARIDCNSEIRFYTLKQN